MIVCSCHNISDRRLVDIIRQHQPVTVEQLTEASMAGSCCGNCSKELAILLQEHSAEVVDVVNLKALNEVRVA